MGMFRPLAAAALAASLLSACGGGLDDDYDDTGGSSAGSSSSSSADALAYPLVDYTFTCSATGRTNTIQVSDGPCISQQRAFAKATSCNEFREDGNSGFDHVGQPLYQCLVNNSSGSYRSYYQQYLSYYGG